MGTKIMLIGLLIIGTIAMLETDVSAQPCLGWLGCRRFAAKESEKAVAEVKQHERSEVLLIGFTGRVGSSKELDRVEREMEGVREMLIQRGLQSDIIRSLILEGYAPQDPKRRGIQVIVAWPDSEKYKR